MLNDKFGYFFGPIRSESVERKPTKTMPNIGTVRSFAFLKTPQLPSGALFFSSFFWGGVPLNSANQKKRRPILSWKIITGHVKTRRPAGQVETLGFQHLDLAPWTAPGTLGRVVPGQRPLDAGSVHLDPRDSGVGAVFPLVGEKKMCCWKKNWMPSG